MESSLLLILSFILPVSLTTLGSALIFFIKKQSKIVTMLTVGLAAGIMLSASIFSLLMPSLEQAKAKSENLFFLPVVLGFLFGGIFMVILDKISAFFFKNNAKNSQKAFKLFAAITIHNIPEGMSVGFAMGSALVNSSPLLAPFMFTLGIALQNFPEGTATTLPIYSCIQHKTKAFLLGTLSGIVEPIFALVGYFLSTFVAELLPWLLAFSAGSMIYVIIEELVPEIHADEKSSLGTWAFVIGFVIMMLLDLCL